jgi:hypothetical protein
MPKNFTNTTKAQFWDRLQQALDANPQIESLRTIDKVSYLLSREHGISYGRIYGYLRGRYCGPSASGTNTVAGVDRAFAKEVSIKATNDTGSFG